MSGGITGMKSILRQRRTALVLYGLLVGATGTMLAVTLEERQRQLATVEGERAGLAADMAVSWVESNFHQAGSLLLAPARDAMESGSHAVKAFDALMLQRAKDARILSQISVIPYDGQALGETLGAHLNSLHSVVERHALALLEKGEEDFRVSPLLRQDGDAIAILRKLPIDDGVTGAIAVGLLDLDVLQQSLASKDLPYGDSLALVDREFRLVARVPDLDAAGAPLHRGMAIQSPELQLAASRHAHHNGIDLESPVDGKRRLYAVRQLEGAPFLLITGRGINLAVNEPA